MAVRFTAGRGRAAKPLRPTFGIPWNERGTNTGTFNRGPAQAPAPGASAALPGLPVDPFYDAAVGSANRNLAAGLAQLQYQRGQLGSTFGLGIDPSGAVFEDVSNPYSRAATLQKLYDQSRRGTGTTMAARGQLYSGAMQNAQNQNAQTNLQRRDEMIRQFMAAQQDLRQRELSAGGAHADALAQAGSDAVMRALANRPDPASVIPAGPPPPPTVVVPARPAKKPAKKRRR